MNRRPFVRVYPVVSEAGPSDDLIMRNRSNNCPSRTAATRRWGLVLALGVLTLAEQSVAQSAARLPAGLRFLTIGSGARAVGLGETMVADGSDPFVIEYNPAGLASIGHFTAAFAHSAFFQDTRGEYITVVVPARGWSWGARIGYMGTDNIPRRTEPSEQPLGFYGASDGVFQGAIARKINEQISAGLSAAYVLEHIDVNTAQGAMFGLGLRFRQGERLTFGAAFANLGPQVRFVERKFRMPDLFRFGATWRDELGTLRAELVALDNENAKWNLGVEATPNPRLSIRAGLRLGYDTQVFNAGLGVHTADGRFSVDYAFAPYNNDLGSTHRFGLSVRP